MGLGGFEPALMFNGIYSAAPYQSDYRPINPRQDLNLHFYAFEVRCYSSLATGA